MTENFAVIEVWTIAAKILLNRVIAEPSHNYFRSLFPTKTCSSMPSSPETFSSLEAMQKLGGFPSSEKL